jgi:hypothetical protein
MKVRLLSGDIKHRGSKGRSLVGGGIVVANQYWVGYHISKSLSLFLSTPISNYSK